MRKEETLKQWFKKKKKRGCPCFKSQATSPVNLVALINAWWSIIGKLNHMVLDLVCPLVPSVRLVYFLWNSGFIIFILFYFYNLMASKVIHTNKNNINSHMDNP